MPYPVQAALVDASGKVFWYWDPYKHCLRKSGVHAATIARLTAGGASKYQVMRELLAELDTAGPQGRRVQVQLVEALSTHPLSDADGIDVAAARAAQQRLRSVAEEHGILRPPAAKQREAAAAEQSAARRRDAAHRRARERESKESRQQLHAEFCQLSREAGEREKQERGYRLEEMLGEVARLDGLTYTPPFRKGTVVQTDGMIGFEGFQYLLEARWRDARADVAALSNLSAKASRNLQSTRGLFLSVVGFRPEVVSELESGIKNILLMTGQEFLLVLEGRVTLRRAFELKVEEGAKRGRIFFDLAKCPSL